MRIRRNAASSSAAPPPESWLHAAAADCDLCQLTRGADPQVAPDGIKLKGQVRIATPEPEAGLEPERGGVESQVAPDGIEHEGQIPIVSPEPEAGLEPGRGGVESQVAPDGIEHEGQVPIASVEPEAGLEPGRGWAESQVAPDRIEHEGHTRFSSPEPEANSDDDNLSQRRRAPQARRRKIHHVRSDSEEAAMKENAIILDEDSDEMESGGATLLVNGSATEPEVTGGVSLASGSIAQPQGIRGVPLADEAVAKRHVLEGVAPATLLVNGSATEPEITGGVSLASGSIAQPQGIRGVPLADEAVAQRKFVDGVSRTTGLFATGRAGASPESQAASDGIKHKGHIAGQEPEGQLKSGNLPRRPPVLEEFIPAQGERKSDEQRVDLAERPPVLDDRQHEIDHEHPAARTEDAAVPEVTGGGAAARTECTEETTPIVIDLSDVSADPRATCYESSDEVDSGGATLLVNGSVMEPGVTGGVSLASVSIAGPEGIRGVSLADEAVAEQEVLEGVSLVSEAATEAADAVTVSGVTTGASLDNKGAREPVVEMEASSVIESAAEMDVTEIGSLAVEDATHPGLSESVSLANKTATKREVSEGVSLVSETAAEPADTVTALEVTTGAPLDNEHVAEPENKMGASLVNESTTGMDCERLGTPVIEATGHPGLAERNSLVSEVVTKTGAANLDNEVSVEPEATVGPSLLNESTELEITGVVSIAKEAAAEPEVIGEASACSEDGGSALNEPQPLDCDLDFATVQVENAGPSVANKMQPSRGDAGDKVGSVSSTSTGPVRDKSPAADEVAPHDDTPSVSCVSGVKARSVGKSGRSDIICYARRKGKRKLDMAEMNTEEVEMDDGDICDQFEEKETLDRTAPCMSAMSTAGSADINLADIKKGLADNLVSSKVKTRKGRYECDINYCRMAFKEKSELSVHKKNTCTVKSCGKRFRCHKHLRRHQSSHNEDTPYKCPWENCGMAFKWTCSLADHFLVHTGGEKPYRCKTPGCSKIYKHVSDLMRHKKRCKPQR